MIAVDRSRARPDESTTLELIRWSKSVRKYYGITAVASIIVYRDGKEIGRIIESPEESLETDLLAILKK
jgi:hypothetical protein